jgi:hypothetical protein
LLAAWRVIPKCAAIVSWPSLLGAGINAVAMRYFSTSLTVQESILMMWETTYQVLSAPNV